VDFVTCKKCPYFDKKRVFLPRKAVFKVKLALQVHFVKNKGLKLSFAIWN